MLSMGSRAKRVEEMRRQTERKKMTFDDLSGVEVASGSDTRVIRFFVFDRGATALRRLVELSSGSESVSL